jgi:predicted oxidoreductase
MIQQIPIAGGVSLSHIAAGCMRFDPAKHSPMDIRNFVEECLALGINTFDHAPVYGAYTEETFFGNAVLKNNNALRDRIKIVTKTGIILPKTVGNQVIYYDSSPAWISGEVEKSLQKLKTDRIDLLLIHRPDYLMDADKTGAALDKLVQSGKVLSLGISNFAASGFSLLQKSMKTPLAINQIELSAKTPDPLFNGLYDDAMERKLPLMAWSPLGGGSIFSSQDAGSIRLRNVLEEIAREYGVSIDTVLYAWIFRLPGKIIPVTGTTKPERIRTAVKAFNLILTHDQWYRILAASRGFDVP